MKITLADTLIKYDGEDMKETGPEGDLQDMTVRKALEIACLSADPAKYKTGDQKYEIYQMLRRISTKDEALDLEAKDVVLLKELIGAIYGPAVVGSVYDLLDPPAEK